MKASLALAAAVALTPATAFAQTTDPQPAFVTAGAGQYEVWCKVTPMSGEETTRFLQPGRATLVLAKVRRADCNYKATSAGPLTLTLSGPEWTCPFSKGSAATCEVSFPATSFGSFELRRKAR